MGDAVRTVGTLGSVVWSSMYLVYVFKTGYTRS